MQRMPRTSAAADAVGAEVQLQVQETSGRTDGTEVGFSHQAGSSQEGERHRGPCPKEREAGQAG